MISFRHDTLTDTPHGGNRSANLNVVNVSEFTLILMRQNISNYMIDCGSAWIVGEKN